MHYYQFNIGDYASHTSHLDPLEDIAYRRMLDYCYLNECGLPETIESIARVIRMRTHCDCIAIVLQEFFFRHDDGTWHHTRVDTEILAYKGKSAKASQSARKRWDNVDANALPTLSEGNANHKPITNNQETNIKPAKQSKKITLGKYLEQCKAGEVKAIPENHPLFDYIKKQSLPEDYVFLCWRRFVDYYRNGSGSKKLYIDWPSTFLNNVKNNYYKLWYLDDNGQYLLTTAGKQAQKEFADHE